MAHWAEIDENNFVIRVTVGSNEDSDEGYQWIIDNLGGRWIKCSYNTVHGIHTGGGTPLRWTYPSPGSPYIEDEDIFLDPSPYPSWILDVEAREWKPPIPKPDSGPWIWDEETVSWKEHLPR